MALLASGVVLLIKSSGLLCILMILLILAGSPSLELVVSTSLGNKARLRSLSVVRHVIQLVSLETYVRTY